jgi:hypothetical protein
MSGQRLCGPIANATLTIILREMVSNRLQVDGGVAQWISSAPHLLFMSELFVPYSFHCEDANLCVLLLDFPQLCLLW